MVTTKRKMLKKSRAGGCLGKTHTCLAKKADERVMDVCFTDSTISVDLMDGRTITVPLAWYLRLLHATQAQKKHWGKSGGGYGIHLPDIYDDLSTEGLLRGASAPQIQFDKASHH
jgi:hypothetical protein